MGNIITNAKNPAIIDMNSLCLFCRFTPATSPVVDLHRHSLLVPDKKFYTCKNFRMANREPPTPIKAPTPQNTARIVLAIDW